MDSPRSRREGARIANTRPRDIDQEIVRLGGTTSAHSPSIREIRGDLKRLNEGTHRLHAEERYFHSVKEKIVQTLPSVLEDADKLSCEISKCHGRLGHGTAAIVAQSEESGGSGEATPQAKTWVQKCIGLMARWKRTVK